MQTEFYRSCPYAHKVKRVCTKKQNSVFRLLPVMKKTVIIFHRKTIILIYSLPQYGVLKGIDLLCSGVKTTNSSVSACWCGPLYNSPIVTLIVAVLFQTLSVHVIRNEYNVEPPQIVPPAPKSATAQWLLKEPFTLSSIHSPLSFLSLCSSPPPSFKWLFSGRFLT